MTNVQLSLIISFPMRLHCLRWVQRAVLIAVGWGTLNLQVLQEYFLRGSILGCFSGCCCGIQASRPVEQSPVCPCRALRSGLCGGQRGGSCHRLGARPRLTPGSDPWSLSSEFRRGWPVPCLTTKNYWAQPKSLPPCLRWCIPLQQHQALPSWTAYTYIIHEHKVLITLTRHRAAKCAYR